MVERERMREGRAELSAWVMTAAGSVKLLGGVFMVAYY